MRTFSIVVLAIMAVCFAPELSSQTSSDGRISGVVFADYFYNVARDTGFSALPNTAVGGARDLNGFKLRRLYFTYDKILSDAFSMRFRIEADESANASNGKIGTFVKDAYIRWSDVFEGSDLTVGIQPGPAFEVSERIWGYRSLEKTILDLRAGVASRDQGISLQGDILNDGMLKYKVMYANGSGNNPESDKYKRYYGRVEASPAKNVVVTVYADLNAQKPLSVPSGDLGNNVLTYAGFVGYADKGVWAAGLEAYMQSTENGFLRGTSYSDRSAIGLSAFARLTVTPTTTLLARADMFDPNTNSVATGDFRNYFIAGLDWQPAENVSIIPNLLVETYESGGGVSADPSLTARVTLVYGF